jgi:NTE family protein
MTAASEAPTHVGWTPGSLERLGERVWLVLGGGGLRGLAHVGAWQAFSEAGLRVSGIVGTSIGALIGACIAGGMGYRELVKLAFSLRKIDIARINRRALLFNGLRQESLLLEEPLRRYIDRIVPVARWADLTLPLQVNAVDLGSGETTWFGSGADESVSLADALYASAALPVFYPPARIGSRVFVDGGTEWALPLQRAAELGATGIVAVDVGSGRANPTHEVLAGGMLAVHQRVFSLMSWRKRADLVAAWERPPLLFVRPRMDGYGTFEFSAVGYFLEEGYRAARAALMTGV